MKILLFLILLLAVGVARADTPTPDISIVNTVREAMSAVASTSIMPQAITWLAALMGLQFVLTNLNLIKSGGDFQAVWAKLLGSLLWFVFCYYALTHGPEFIDSVGSDMLTKFASNLPTPSSVILATLSLCTSILIGIAATGTSIAGVGNSSIAMVLVYVLFIIFGIGMFLAIKLIMLQLELGLIVMLSPLSFSFLGLNALKDQGIAPFKSLISLVYRIILLGIVYSAFGKVISVAGTQLDSFSWANPLEWAAKINIIFAMLCAFPVIAYLVFKSDSIASSLAGGSTSMGTGDVASAAAAGAAAGGAVASGGASAAATAGKTGQSMGDFMKSLSTGGGSISNASGSGQGGFEPVGSAPVAPSKPPEMSLQELRSHPSAIRNRDQSSSQSNTSPNPSSSPSPSKPSNQSAPPSSNVGSDSSAGIGGSSGVTDQKLDKLIDSMSKPNQKPSFGDRASRLNDHVAREQAATNVSINTNHHD
ncbi:MAG: hypothetical protein WC426_01695 [Sulfuriferula sp.]